MCSPIFRFAVLAAALALAACGEKPEPYVEKPVEDLYNEAMNTLEERLYLKAARQFEEVERQHPYSAWATKAQVMAGFSFYQGNKYDDAIATLDQFIEVERALSLATKPTPTPKPARRSLCRSPRELANAVTLSENVCSQIGRAHV